MKKKVIIVLVIISLLMAIFGVVFHEKDSEIVPMTLREKIMVRNAVRAQFVKDSLDCVSKMSIK